jgi:magnesium-transporting ATPase (P-type)
MEEKNYPQTGLTFIGLMSLTDPPKPTVARAISDVRAAGLKVVMVTGDHPITAAAIARQVGIITQSTRSQLAKMQQISPELVAEDTVNAIVVHGAELSLFDDREWDRVLSKSEVNSALKRSCVCRIYHSRFADSAWLCVFFLGGVCPYNAAAEAADRRASSASRRDGCGDG